MKTVEQMRRARLEELGREFRALEEVAARAGTSAVYLSQLRNQQKTPAGTVRSIGNELARRLESGCGKPVGWLDVENSRVEGKQQGNTSATSRNNVTAGPQIRGRVPLISWARAGSWDEVSDVFQPGEADEWIDTTARVGPHAFALRVRGDSMTAADDRRSLPDGVVVILDPGAVGPLEALHNRIVLAKRTDDPQATLKLLWFDGATPWLKPLNPRYPMLPCPADTRIVAVAKRVEIDL